MCSQLFNNSGAEEPSYKKALYRVIRGHSIKPKSASVHPSMHFPLTVEIRTVLVTVCVRTVCYGRIAYDRFTALHQPAALWKRRHRIQRKTAPINAFIWFIEPQKATLAFCTIELYTAYQNLSSGLVKKAGQDFRFPNKKSSFNVTL